jgi:hypothetical protein
MHPQRAPLPRWYVRIAAPPWASGSPSR